MGRREMSIVGRGVVIVAIACLGLAAAVALAASTTLSTEKVKQGKVLDTSTKHALYLFTGRSCTGSCAKVWHPLIASGHVSVARGSGLNAKLVGTVRSNGTSQVTYNRHPLYTYSGDKKAGQTSGEGISSFGGHWYLVSPSGNAVKAKCPVGYIPSSSGCVPGSY